VTPGTLTLVRARLDAPPEAWAEGEGWLSSDERARIERFRFERHARRQRVATVLLRGALGSLTGRDPASLEFRVGEHGKPSVPGGPPFNVSHSGDWWLFGWADEGRVGVDVEVRRELSDLEAVAARSFHPDEFDRVMARSGAERTAAFFRVWSRKEAFIKAVGMGLAYPLEGFVVSDEPDPAAGLLAVRDPAESVGDWMLRPVEWSTELGAAVAWDRPGGAVRWGDLRDFA
jgi:4'-phosphopantetheinyl transferase